MKKHIIYFVIILCAALATSCKPNQESETASTAPKDSTVQNKRPDESGYVDVNGLKMYYEVYGKGKPIVLIHGSYMTIPLNWARIIPMFKDRKVIVAEMQGHGRTRDIERKFSYQTMADDVSGLIDHLKLDSADVLGYSMGAGVAFQLAVRHPEQVRRLVIVSGTYTHDGWWPEAEALWPSVNADMFKGSSIQKQYDSLGNDPAHFPDFVKKVISIDIEKYDWTKDVKKIQVPIFTIIGDADGVRYEHALELFRAKGGGKMGDMAGLPKSRLAIIPGTTHVGMLMRANWWVPMVEDFLDSNLDPTPPTF
jgi:pimeloyl-ACP methyl ester carboxylesterase